MTSFVGSLDVMPAAGCGGSWQLPQPITHSALGHVVTFHGFDARGEGAQPHPLKRPMAGKLYWTDTLVIKSVLQIGEG